VPIHPLLTAVLVLDTLVLMLMTGAAAAAFRVALAWDPDDTGRHQLKLEARQEVWSLAATIAAWVYLAGGLLLVGTFTTILPGVVPGAMCGTGVLQACAPHGHRMLIWRFLGTVGLLCWQRLEVLNRSDPRASLTPNNARVLLMLMPILLLGYFETFRTLTGFDTTQPVDCCTALYDRIATTRVATSFTDILRHAAVWLFGLTTVALPLLAWGLRPRPNPGAVRRATILVLVAAAWLVASSVTLVRVLAPYHYEVLHHYCPWCLFLPAHRGVGFPLLACWGLVALEAVALWALVKAGARPAAPLPAANFLISRARYRLVIGVLGFGLLAAGPALWWRWQFGLWIGS
jgi:hypothetical protein